MSDDLLSAEDREEIAEEKEACRRAREERVKQIEQEVGLTAIRAQRAALELELARDRELVRAEAGETHTGARRVARAAGPTGGLCIRGSSDGVRDNL